VQRAAVINIQGDGVVLVGRDGGGSAPQKGRFVVRSGGQVVWEPLVPGQETAEVDQPVQGLAPGEAPRTPPPAAGHASAQGTAPGEVREEAAPVPGEALSAPGVPAETAAARGQTTAPPTMEQKSPTPAPDPSRPWGVSDSDADREKAAAA
jgi:hypothetical protein